MRVVPILTASILVLGCAACGAGGGGGPGDLGLAPTLPAVTTTSVAQTTTTARGGTKPGEVSQTARAQFSRLAVYGRPDAPAPFRVLANPWTVRGSHTKVPQILLVEGRRADGWIRVLLPDTPKGRDGWVRAFDVRVTRVPYRVRIDRAAHRINVLERTRVIARGPIAVAAARHVEPGHYYLRRVISSRRSRMTANPYVYGLVPQLSSRLPLGTPVDVA